MPTSSEYATPPHPPAKTPLWELLALALPTVAQMASYTVMNFTDTLMLSDLGLLAPTAAANASLFGFALISVGFGIMWVVNTLVSQAFGRGDARACGQHLWAGIWVGVVYGLLMLPLILVGRPLFDFFKHEPELAAMEASYFAIMLLFTPLRLAGAAGAQFLLAIDQPNKPLIAAVIAVAVNIFANYVLIWGHFGFPAMGLAGAAWGSNVGSVVEVIVVAGFCARGSIRRRFPVTDWRPRWQRVKTLLRVGLPSGLQMIGDVLAWAIFGMWVIAFFGTEAMAANTFMMRYMAMSFLPAFGLSAGVTALVGRYIGRGEPDVSAARARLGFQVAAIYMLCLAVLFVAFRYPLIGVFTDDPEVLRLGAMLMIFAGIYQLFDAMYIIYSGALRGAGDTFVPAVVTAALCWIMIIGMGGAAAYFLPGLGVAGPWTVATVYGFVLGGFMFLRFRAGRWRQIVLERHGTSDHAPAHEAAFGAG